VGWEAGIGWGGLGKVLGYGGRIALASLYDIAALLNSRIVRLEMGYWALYE
jgi:hypothetical protein